MTEIVMDQTQVEQADQQPEQANTKCSTPGCIRPAPHEGMRHRYAPTKDLQPEPESAPVSVPEPDRRPRYGSIEEKPYNHALSTVDDGIQVAWSHCAATTCLQHITRCECPSGPLEPPYITRWRTRQFPINDPVPVTSQVQDIASEVGFNVISADDVHIVSQEERAATHICDSCGELLYLLDTPSGKRAYTVKHDENYCTVDDAGIHFARDITDADREANPDWFNQEADEDQQWAEDPDLPDAARRNTDEEAPTIRATDDPEYDAAQVEQTPVETESTSNIDPEVGF